MESLNPDSSRFLNEESVLKPTSLSLPLPTFELLDVVIFDQLSNLVNLLDVKAGDGPFIVRGKLVIDKETRSRLLHPRPTGSHIWIEVDSCTDYSFSQGPTAIWAAGRSGWFEINPAQAYEGYYRDMYQIVNLYYSLLDWHGKNPKKGHSIEDILFLFALEDGTGMTFSGMETLFRRHGIFLISEMLKPTENGVTWKDTAIFRRIALEYPETLYQLSGIAVEDLQGPAEPFVKPFSLHPSIENHLIFGKAPEPLAKNPTTVAGWVVLLILQADANGSCPKEKLTIPKLANWIYRYCSMAPAEAGRAAIRLNAKEIVAKLPDTDDWKDQPFYKELKGYAKHNPMKVDDKAALEPFLPLRVREKKPRKKTVLHALIPRLDSEPENRPSNETSQSESESPLEETADPKMQRASKSLPATQAAHRSHLRPIRNADEATPVSEASRSLKRRRSSAQLTPLAASSSPESEQDSSAQASSVEPYKFPAPHFYHNGEAHTGASGYTECTIESMSLVEYESRNLPNAPEHLVEFLIKRGEQAKAEKERRRRESGRQLGVGSRSSSVNRIVRTGFFGSGY